MAIRLPFRVHTTAATAGTGTITLNTADTTLYRDWVTHYGSGTVMVPYCLIGPATSKFFELGLAAFTGSSKQLARTSNGVIESSNANLLVNIPAAVTYDAIAVDLGSAIPVAFGVNTTLTIADDLGQFYFNGGVGASLTLPDAALCPPGWTVYVQSASFSTLTINTTGSQAVFGLPGGASPVTFTLTLGMAVELMRMDSGPTWIAVLSDVYTKVNFNGVKLLSQNVTVSSAGPSGGASGDVWFQV